MRAILTGGDHAAFKPVVSKKVGKVGATNAFTDLLKTVFGK